jgi:ubiquinone/menaquinone biosynthesis C-methylase UbiE
MDTERQVRLPAGVTDPFEVKTCCAIAYQSDWAHLLLGDSFHPGGLPLTERLGTLLELAQGMRVLDVAAGQGASAIFLARRFGCEVVGIDYGAALICAATEKAEAAGVGQLTRFEEGDAETLVGIDDGAFDAVICECAFCTFPNKRAAAQQFMRVLRPGGRVGLSDLTRVGDTPANLQRLLAWIACIADAQPLEAYSRYLEDVGLRVILTEEHVDALARMVQDIRGKLLGAELLTRLKKFDLPSVDFEQAKTLARDASEAVKAGRFGYAILLASKHE